MIVLKFGGTSVGTPQGMKNVYQIISRYKADKIVVLSAISGTTNSLVEITQYLQNNELNKAREIVKTLESHYKSFIDNLYSKQELKDQANEIIQSHWNSIKALINDGFLIKHQNIILSQGELMSTALFRLLMDEYNQESHLISALDFMRIDKDLEPDEFYIKQNIKHVLEKKKSSLYITQGYICRNVFGEIDNLKRGGSDFTATLIGQAIIADRIEIWTDIDGMHNNDPRCVDNTQSLKSLDFDEASELAYFGAKILHPSCVFPAQKAGIPILLKNTMRPDALGTTISSEKSQRSVTAIAAKDGITAIKIKSGRMLNAYGFLRSVFEVFERYKTPIDMITTSEVAVSLSIDSDTYLSEIIEELGRFGEVTIDKNQSIICIVGDFSAEKTSQANKIFTGLRHIPIRMISYGGSQRNVSILVSNSQKNSALQTLHTILFND